MTEREGEKDRKIELGMRLWKGEWNSKNRMNTNNSNQGNVSFINKNIMFCVLKFFVYRMTIIERGD